MSRHLLLQHCTVSFGRARSSALCCNSSQPPGPGHRGHTSLLAKMFVLAAAPCGDATDSATNLITLSVKELKALAKEAGVDITGCAEKSEIVRCLQDVHKSPGADRVADELMFVFMRVAAREYIVWRPPSFFMCRSHACFDIRCHFWA